MQKVCDSKSENTSENKRKALKDLSTNLYTEKYQKQVKRMTDIKKKSHIKNK